MTLPEILYASGSVVVSLGGGACIVFAMSSYLGRIWAERLAREHSSLLAEREHEHHTRFSSIHVKQAELIAELYSELQDLRMGLNYFSFLSKSDPLDSLDFAGRDLRKKSQNARLFFKRNRIYFTEELATKMEEFMSLCTKPAITQRLIQFEEDDSKRVALSKAAEADLRNAVDQAATALKQMEEDFRLLLGVRK